MWDPGTEVRSFRFCGKCLLTSKPSCQPNCICCFFFPLLFFPSVWCGVQCLYPFRHELCRVKYVCGVVDSFCVGPPEAAQRAERALRGGEAMLVLPSCFPRACRARALGYCCHWHGLAFIRLSAWLLVRAPCLWLFKNPKNPSIQSFLLHLQLYVLCVKHVLVAEYPRAVTRGLVGAHKREREARLGSPQQRLWRSIHAGSISRGPGHHSGRHPQTLLALG